MLDCASSSAGSWSSHSATRAVRPSAAASKMSSSGPAARSTATASRLSRYWAISTADLPRSSRAFASAGFAFNSACSRPVSPARTTSKMLSSISLPNPWALEGKSLAECKGPRLTAHAWTPAVSERQLRRVAANRARRPESDRKSRVPALTGRLVAIPGATVVHERRRADREQPEDLVGHEDAILEYAPGRARAREVVQAEQARLALLNPGIELGAGLGMRHDAALGVGDQRVARDVLADDRQLAARPRRVEPVGVGAKQQESALPDGRALAAELVAQARLHHHAEMDCR